MAKALSARVQGLMVQLTLDEKLQLLHGQIFDKNPYLHGVAAGVIITSSK